MEQETRTIATAYSAASAQKLFYKYSGMLTASGLTSRYGVRIETSSDGVDMHDIVLVDRESHLPPPPELRDVTDIQRSRQHRLWAEGEHQQPEVPPRQRHTLRGALYSWQGESHTLPEWADLLDIPYHTLYGRLRNGWTIAQALTTPVRGSAR